LAFGCKSVFSLMVRPFNVFHIMFAFNDFLCVNFETYIRFGYVFISLIVV
jgi:hypothetical protein